MDKLIRSKSKTHKTFIGFSKAIIDLIYVITSDSSYVITADGSYVIAQGGSIQRNLSSLMSKWIVHMATASKIVKKVTKITKNVLANNRFTKKIIKNSKIKKVREYDE